MSKVQSTKRKGSARRKKDDKQKRNKDDPIHPCSFILTPLSHSLIKGYVVPALHGSPVHRTFFLYFLLEQANHYLVSTG